MNWMLRDRANKAGWRVKEIKSTHLKMTLEVIEKKDDYKLAYNWFPTKQKAENFCLGRIKSK